LESVQAVIPYPLEDKHEALTVTPPMHQFLIQSYWTEVHPLYPFLDPSIEVLSIVKIPGPDLPPIDSFVLNMVYSIACHCVPGEKHRFQQLGSSCYRRALNHINVATSDLTVVTLQSITLLALHSLFDPQNGNFGQLIGFAARLVTDIGGYDTPDRETRMQKIHTSIYCMENHYATVLDRPSFLPEPNRPLEFDLNHTSEYLCSLHRIQSRYRDGPAAPIELLVQEFNTEELKQQVELGNLSPNVVSTLLETQLLLDPQPLVAVRLIDSYYSPRSIHTFLTPQWTYRAGLILLEAISDSQSREGLLPAYGTCSVILDRAALRWPAATALRESLQSYAKTRL